MTAKITIAEVSKNDCCGCTACYAVCPTSCISMKEDQEGFLYPSIDQSACVGCSRCVKTCPVVQPFEEKPKEQGGFVFEIFDPEVLLDSTSGGAFTAIARWVFEKKGVVFGVGYGHDGLPVHKMARNEKGIAEFRGSKYAQSRLDNTFQLVKEELGKQRYVLFTGTPCQVEGLLRFLGTRPDHLVLVDVVCHAVPSPLVLQRYWQYLGQISNCSDYSQLRFRDKRPFGYQYSQLTLRDCRDGKAYYRQGVETDPFLRAFFSEICNRPSCYACRFKKRYRVCDLTIWDCFNASDFDSSMSDDRGANKMLAHSALGREIVASLSARGRLSSVNVDQLIEGEREMIASVPMNENRSLFLKDCRCVSDPEELFAKWFPSTSRTMIERSLRRAMSRMGIMGSMKKLAKNLLGR